MNTEKFEDAFLELVETDTEQALQLITGMFVGLTLEYARRRGEDASKTLRINGCGNRDITIHAVVPNAPAQGCERSEHPAGA